VVLGNMPTMERTTFTMPRTGGCWVCADSVLADTERAAYAYLLGQYLGDGRLVTRARVPVLRIYTCTDYPQILLENQQAIVVVRKAQPCAIPQHGPGRKHERPMALVPWQHEIVRTHPWPLIRGLIHSDGRRAINRIMGVGKSYRYPRYFLSNKSRDILSIMGDALDQVGVAWRYNRPDSISIARREAVAAMDAHVGPKR
jgi:hypothetical protein